jgi:hypothetical protein
MAQESAMNEDRLNIEIRKFLKTVGVTSQREIENAVRAADKAGKLKGKTRLAAKMTLSLPEIGLSCSIDGAIDFETPYDPRSSSPSSA